MSDKISRRSFMKQSTALGIGSAVAGDLLAGGLGTGSGQGVDISVVVGNDYLKNTVKAVEQLGGMGRFVKKNSKIGILANPQRNNPGAYTNPQVLKGVIQLCKKAGAKEINCISWLPEKNWTATGLKKVVEDEGANLIITDRKDESLFKGISVPKGKELKEARLMKTLYDNDAFITIPVCKDHAGNKFTGTLKNMMGINSPKNNRGFHQKGWTKNPDAIRYLDQCIADLNLVLKPVLCVVDATEFIITKGPFGPGKLLSPRKVVAGVDRVAIDAYCCTLWGLKPEEIYMIKASHQHGLGEINLKKVKIKEVKA